jgi:hypothetical protein
MVCVRVNLIVFGATLRASQIFVTLVNASKDHKKPPRTLMDM